jgi:hypothetical protein
MTESLTTDECLASQTHRAWHDRNNRDCCGGDICRPKLVTPEIEEAIEGIGIKHDEVEAVIEERMSVYGPPEENLQAIADAYEAYRLNMGNRRYTIQDLCNMECLKKLIRMARTPEHPDSVKDIKAYRLLAETVK